MQRPTAGFSLSFFSAALLALASAGFSAAAAANSGFKCIGADGQIEYRELRVEGMDCTALRPTPPPSSDPQVALEKLREKAAAGDREQEQLGKADQRAQNCERARNNVAILESDKDVIQSDSDGNKSVLSAEQRDAALAQTRKDIDYWCDS